MSTRRLAKEQPASFDFTPETLEKVLPTCTGAISQVLLLDHVDHRQSRGGRHRIRHVRRDVREPPHKTFPLDCGARY